MEAKPVGRDIEPPVEKEVSLEGTGTHWTVTGEKTAVSKVNPEKPQGLEPLTFSPVLRLSCPHL